MTYQQVKKSVGHSLLQRKQSQMAPSAIDDNDVQTNSPPPLATTFTIPSRAERDVIRKSFFGTQGEQIQTKLTVGEPGDKYEQQADRVAAQVVNQINAPMSSQPDQSQSIQRQAMPEEEQLQMKAIAQRQLDGGMAATPDLEASINQARGSGQPLAGSIRQPMERSFGADFSGVKVHTDAQSHQLNQSIQAKAFTTGQELIAHELTHVVQQNGDVVQKRTPQLKSVSKLNETEIAQMYSKFAADKRQKELDKIVWVGHKNAIAKVCQKHKYTIAIRETGALSIKRIAEGAKAKPHTILEKSIKKSSLERGHAQTANEILSKLEKWDLDGFVGHWNQDHQLIGLRIDNIPQEVEQQVDVHRDQGIPYVLLDLNSSDGGPTIVQLKKLTDWKKYLYTGDYDLHEAYSAQGGGGGQIPEATTQKVDLLNRLNEGVRTQGENSAMRGGKATLHGETNRVHVEGDYAMFQHGDQATYRMNQHLEAQELKTQVAKLVPAVATESEEPIAWCKMGQWFVTMNKLEHDVFRRVNKIKKPHTWSQKEDQRMERGKQKEQYL
jgi:hypothetical protein